MRRAVVGFTFGPGLNPLFKSQSYLDPAPVGIDALAAWKVKGGDGENIQIIDIEQGWNLGHEDLVSVSLKYPGSASNPCGRQVRQHISLAALSLRGP